MTINAPLDPLNEDSGYNASDDARTWGVSPEVKKSLEISQYGKLFLPHHKPVVFYGKPYLLDRFEDGLYYAVSRIEGNEDGYGKMIASEDVGPFDLEVLGRLPKGFPIHVSAFSNTYHSAAILRALRYHARSAGRDFVSFNRLEDDLIGRLVDFSGPTIKRMVGESVYHVEPVLFSLQAD